MVQFYRIRLRTYLHFVCHICRSSCIFTADDDMVSCPRKHCFVLLQIKIAVVYISLSLVALILGTIALRAVVAFVTYLLAGRTLWLLPNMLSEVCRILQLWYEGMSCFTEIFKKGLMPRSFHVCWPKGSAALYCSSGE